MSNVVQSSGSTINYRLGGCITVGTAWRGLYNSTKGDVTYADKPLAGI